MGCDAGILSRVGYTILTDRPRPAGRHLSPAEPPRSDDAVDMNKYMINNSYIYSYICVRLPSPPRHRDNTAAGGAVARAGIASLPGPPRRDGRVPCDGSLRRAPAKGSQAWPPMALLAGRNAGGRGSAGAPRTESSMRRNCRHPVDPGDTTRPRARRPGRTDDLARRLHDTATRCN